ncbi:hypothetical protein [Halomonas sp. RT37]|uniref:Uncharacterized protein n=1 Tax=Halomonas sp. RT37 TaxID=2950872 RepID=A0AAU7KKI1_9GAMM
MPSINKVLSFILTLFLTTTLHGCDNLSNIHKNDEQSTAFIEMENSPYFIANAPSRYALSDRLENIDMTQLTEDSKKTTERPNLSLD